jgi:hypothetical protein
VRPFQVVQYRFRLISFEHGLRGFDFEAVLFIGICWIPVRAMPLEELPEHHRSEEDKDMENSSRLFEGDVIAPEQYREIFSRSRHLEPEQELMLAILCDAIECIFKYCDEPVPARAKLFHDAQEWLFDEEEKEPFSFLNVCDSLNFDPSYLRRGVLEKMRVKSVLTLANPGRRTDRLARIGGQLKISPHQGGKKRISL